MNRIVTITVKQHEKMIWDERAKANRMVNIYKILKLKNTVSWTIGGTFTKEELNEIITHKIAEVIIQ